MSDERYESLRRTLDATHEWPCVFVFKFIGAVDAAERAAALFPKETVTRRFSRAGKYLAVTAEVNVGCADDVLDVYAKARGIEGLICL